RVTRTLPCSRSALPCSRSALPCPAACAPLCPAARASPCPAASALPCPAAHASPCPAASSPPCPAARASPCPAACALPCPAACASPCPAASVLPFPAACASPCPADCTPPFPAARASPCPAASTPPCPAARTPPCPAARPVMATPPVLAFAADGLPFRFNFWLYCLRLHLRCYIRDGVSLLEHTLGSLLPPTTPTEPAADADEDVQRRYRADSLAYRQWTECDAVAQRAVRSLLPVDQRDHFQQVTSAQALFDAVVRHYSSLSPAT
ncbi:unnamed protein product, partial [Closterium sp. NIES-53]